MTRRPPRRPGKGSYPAPSRPAGNGDEIISALKSVPVTRHGGSDTERISARKDAPVALLDREGDAATVIAFPEPPARRRRRWLLAGVATVLLIVGGLLAYLIWSPALAVRALDVQGNQLVPEEQISAALAPLMGIPLTQIGEDDVDILLQDFTPIESVSIAAAPPSTLSVTVVERTPVAVLESGGKFVLIDSEGRQLTTVATRESAALPLIDGGTNAVNSKVFSTITAVLSALPSDIRERLVHASAESMDSVQLKLTDGQTIFWGSAEENTGKARVLAALLEMPEPETPVKVYDVSTPSRPVTR